MRVAVALAGTVLAVFGTGLVAGVTLVGTETAREPAPVVEVRPDPFRQESFPCQEDELLGYAPRFGPDRVGCIHWEEVEG